jgi:protein involved in ribonucleotide reduction
MITIDKPAVLILPTYGAGPRTKAVPKQVIQFLNIKQNRDNIVGVIGTGNTNFGEAYGLAADIVAQKLGVPMLYKLEIFGTPEDVQTVKTGLKLFMEEKR